MRLLVRMFIVSRKLVGESKLAHDKLPTSFYIWVAMDVYLGGAVMATKYVQILLGKVRSGANVTVEYLKDTLQKAKSAAVDELCQLGKNLGLGDKGEPEISLQGEPEMYALQTAVLNAFKKQVPKSAAKYAYKEEMGSLAYFDDGAEEKKNVIVMEKIFHLHVAGRGDGDEEPARKRRKVVQNGDTKTDENVIVMDE